MFLGFVLLKESEKHIDLSDLYLSSQVNCFVAAEKVSFNCPASLSVDHIKDVLLIVS